MRLLVDVATPETASSWVELARGRTVRALEANIARHRGRPVECDDTLDNEPRVQIRLRCPRRVRERWHEVTVLARAMCGGDVPPWSVADAVAGEGLSARGVVPDAPMAPLPDDDPPPERIDPHEPRAEVDWTAAADVLPDDVARLDERVSDLDAFALDRRMRAILRAMQRIDSQMGRLLHTLLAQRLHRFVGFASLAAYARERLGICPRKARALVALERRTWEVPALLAAYRDGELSWLRALTIMQVANATTGPAWVARAKAVTVRRLVDEVEWVVETRAADGAPPLPGTPLVLPERQIGAHEEEAPLDTAIVLYAPASVKILLHEAVTAFAEPPEPRWRSFERLLDRVHTEWRQSHPRHRDPIFDRDGWRCAVPACSSQRNLHDHHLLFRSRGGSNARDNRITVCAWHHLRGIHQGRIRAWGTAPHDITWELGVRPGYAALIRLRGDEYVTVD